MNYPEENSWNLREWQQWRQRERFLVVAAVALVSLFSVPVSAQPTVDGVVDAIYGAAIATDKAGDAQGTGALDLRALHLYADANQLYVAITINGDIVTTNWAKYMLYIDTTNDTHGATSDAWGRKVSVSDPHKPEFSINAWVDQVPFGPQKMQLWAWNAGTWAQLSGVGIAAAAIKVQNGTSVLEYAVPRAIFGGATTIWVWERTFDMKSDFAGSIMHRPACAEAVGLTCCDLNRLAEEVTALQRLKPQAVLLHSVTALVWDGGRYTDARDKLYTALAFTGLKLGFVTERMLERGELPDAPLLFVPGIVHLSDAAFETLGRYRGRLILVGGDGLLSRNEYDRERGERLEGERVSFEYGRTTWRKLWLALVTAAISVVTNMALGFVTGLAVAYLVRELKHRQIVSCACPRP